MRRIDPTVSVILMSGYSQSEVEHDSSVGFLQKPFAAALLLSRIDQVLSGT